MFALTGSSINITSGIYPEICLQTCEGAATYTKPHPDLIAANADINIAPMYFFEPPISKTDPKSFFEKF